MLSKPQKNALEALCSDLWETWIHPDPLTFLHRVRFSMRPFSGAEEAFKEAYRGTLRLVMPRLVEMQLAREKGEEGSWAPIYFAHPVTLRARLQKDMERWRAFKNRK